MPLVHVCTIRLLLALALAGLPLLPLTARAAPDFSAYLADFRQALARNDSARIASLTRLPFLFEGHQQDRQGFIRIYPQLFDAPTRRCLARTRPMEEDGARVIFCQPYAFYFRLEQGAWRLVEFAADGEDMP
ncbi:MAG: hypothetical protein AB1421_14295 [Pseudomonadota bacterium]